LPVTQMTQIVSTANASTTFGIKSIAI
jgi:hypothetical protein